MPNKIVIALGSNQPSHAGGPQATLAAAIARLTDNDATVRKVSRYYKSTAWPDPNDPAFVNAVAIIETARDPQALMTLLHETEDAFGRVRGPRNAPRTLDLDLIDYDSRVEAGPPALPHPRVEMRGFVLIPLCDVAPDWRHPATGVALDDLIAALPEEARAVTPLAASKA
jgi:2-amino-4-hydroxy-6-hydroxymethyldihydropteridine diphosphokinase